MYYIIEFWHTELKKWIEHTVAYNEAAAEEVYQRALDWHYAKTVRISKVTEEIIKQSKVPEVVR